MFGRNYLRECNTAVRSITYLLFVVALLAMFFTQYSPETADDLKQAQKGILYEDTLWGGTDNSLLVKPFPGATDYGRIDAEIPDQVMQNVAYRMFRDISNNRYQTYALGVLFTDHSFDDAELKRAKEIFKEVAGESFEQVQNKFYEMDLARVMELFPVTEAEAKEYLENTYYKKLTGEFTPNHATSRLYEYEKYIPVSKSLSYEEFKSLVGKFKSMIGGKTVAYERMADYGSVPLTYEASLARYHSFVADDGISGAYARLFCDYMGIVAGIVPTFLAAAVAMGEIRRRKYEMLADDVSAENPGGKDLAARFLAVVTVTFLPILILSVVSTISLAAGVKPLELTVDRLAFTAYSIAWLLPTLMFSVAVGLFFAELTKTPVGILVQFVIWACSVSLWTADGLNPVKYGANLFLRHSVVGEYQIYRDSFYEIAANRIGYALAAVLLISAAMYLRKKPAMQLWKKSRV